MSIKLNNCNAGPQFASVLQDVVRKVNSRLSSSFFHRQRMLGSYVTLLMSEMSLPSFGM